MTGIKSNKWRFCPGLHLAIRSCWTQGSIHGCHFVGFHVGRMVVGFRPCFVQHTANLTEAAAKLPDAAEVVGSGQDLAET